VVDEVIGQS